MSEQPVIDQDGQVIDPAAEPASSEGEPTTDPTALVQQPAKVMRIGTMIEQLRVAV